MEAWRCVDEAEAREAVAWAAAEGDAVRIVGHGTKAALGRPVASVRKLDLSGLSGITLYEPEELILRARAGTPIATILRALSAHGQMLPFEPRDIGPLLGEGGRGPTLGGIVSTNLSGPRRFKQGAVRDFVLGLTAINGQGDIFHSGGRVMKNVTGYDLPKLLTGAYGTLGVITEITLKILPAPEAEATILMAGFDDRAGLAALTEAVASPFCVTGAAHLPQSVAARSAQAPLAALGASLTLLRLEGPPSAIKAAQDALLPRLRHPGFHLGPLAERGGVLVLGEAESRALWAEIRDVHYFCDWPGTVWRVSTAPASGYLIAASVGATAWFYDWAGGLVWLLMADEPHGGEPLIRRAVAAAGGHATLIRGDLSLRGEVSVFEPQPQALAQLTRRIKQAFDPAHILNPGLIYAEP
jgi:glycolate oxidase FAD binding subunit